ncbi:MAG: ATP-binding protein [Gammaproteobacteria bacterium]|nr:ATP-binding protein [Gammaproteobacteria bacterium]
MDGESNEIDTSWKSIAIPLRGFEYVHAPYDENIKDSVHLFAGRDSLRDRLVSVLQSKQRKRGSYLIAGYRGAGKTSIVNRAIEKYNAPTTVGKEKQAIVVKINLGDNSDLTPFDIYFSIAGFLLDEFQNDDAEIKAKLTELAERMGHEISETRHMEIGANAGIGLRFMSIGINGSDKGSESKKLLPMSPRQAEERLLKILSSIDETGKFKVIFVFDEIDKLSNAEEFIALGHQERAFETTPQDKHARINTLLGTLKNFITTAKATFFFISGRETLDRYYSEKGSPNSLYESLFDNVFEVPSLLTDERYYSSRPWRMALLIEEYLCRRLMKKQKKDDNADKEYYTLKKCHKIFIEETEGNEKNSDSRLLASVLRDFIYYLTFHSWGNPKRLSSILESFIVPGPVSFQGHIKSLGKPDDESAPWLLFDANQLRAFSLAAELVSLFEHQFSREISKMSDKLTVTSLASLQFILKHHTYGFSRESLHRMSEAMSVHRSPALNAIVDDLLTQTFKSYIRRVRNGVYRYRFHSGFEQELRYIIHVSELESAAYNFSLDSMRHVKRFFEDILARADNREKSATWRSHITLGDICAIEQSYNEASAHYCSVIHLLKQEIRASRDDIDLELLMHYVESMMKNGDLEEHRQNYSHAAAIYAEAKYAVDNVLSRNTSVAGNLNKSLKEGDSKWDILKQPFWAGQYLSLKRSPRTASVTQIPELIYKENDLRFYLRAANLAFFSGDIKNAIEYYRHLCNDTTALSTSNERNAYLKGNAMVGLVEVRLVEASDSLFNDESLSSTTDLITKLSAFMSQESKENRDFAPPGQQPFPDLDIIKPLSKAAEDFEDNRIYISAALTHMKLISYLSSILDATGETSKDSLKQDIEKIYKQALKSGKHAIRCINKARQMESSQSGKTLLIRDFHGINYEEESNLNIPQLFDVLLGTSSDTGHFPLEEQIYWQQSLWAHKLAAALVWAQFTYYKATGTQDPEGSPRKIDIPSNFSTLSIRPAIVMHWLRARDISRRLIDGRLVEKNNDKHRRSLDIFDAYLSEEKPSLLLTNEGKNFAEFCASFNDLDRKADGSPIEWPPVLESAYLVCENLYFALTSIRIISRRNIDLVFPRMSQIYFAQWKLLTYLSSAILLDRDKIRNPSGEKLDSIRDISFLLQRMFVKLNKEKYAPREHEKNPGFGIQRIDERIPPTHFDYEYTHLRLSESLDSAISLVDQTSRARTGIFHNKYYCHDDYNDAEFSMDYTLAYMFTPSARFLREHVNETHEQFSRCVIS